MSAETIIIIRRPDSSGDIAVAADDPNQKTVPVSSPPTPSDFWNVIKAAISVLKGE